MRIVQVTPYFAPAWAYGGPPRSIYELARELVGRGHEVSVVTTDALDAQSRMSPLRETIDGIDVHRFRNLSNRLAWTQQLFLPRGVGPFLRTHLPAADVVHLHMYRNLLNVTVNRETRRLRKPYVLSARGSLPRIVRRQTTKGLFDRTFGRRVLGDAAKVVALSTAERLQYERMGVQPSKVAVVHNGIDLKAFDTLPPSGTFTHRFGLDDKCLITYLGRLNARKGLPALLQAFQRIAGDRADTILVLAGPDEGYRARLVRLSESLGISDRVVFTGLVAGEARLGAFVDSRVIVYPAEHEAFGLVPFEALACRRPVVVADDSGCGEIIREAQAGLAVPVHNVLGLAKAITAAIDAEPDITQSVERGRTFVAARLDWHTIAAQMEEVYRAALVSPETSVS